MSVSVKNIYRSTLKSAETLPMSIEVTKTRAAEIMAIVRKSPIYRDIEWTSEQQKEFDAFWIENYGRKISNRWHKLYQAMSGEFHVDYIPEMLYTTQIEPLMNDRSYAVALEDKSLLETICHNCGCVLPKTFFVCSAGQFYDSNRLPISQEQAYNRLAYSGQIVLKHTIGSNSGRGIEFLNVSDEVGFKEKSALISMGRDYIVQERIIPHPIFATLNATSINTIRLITYICDDETHHAPISLRVGRDNSNVDNIHAGGLVIGVEDDGQLLPTAFELGYGDRCIKYTHHPDTNVCFKDVVLPNIEGVIRAGYQMHGKFPHIGIISWDFTINDQNQVILVEANIMGQSVWFPQIVHGKGIFGNNTKKILHNLRCKGDKG